MSKLLDLLILNLELYSEEIILIKKPYSNKDAWLFKYSRKQ